VNFNSYFFLCSKASAAAATIIIELYRIDNKIEKLIKTCSTAYSLQPTSSLDAAGS